MLDNGGKTGWPPGLLQDDCRDDQLGVMRAGGELVTKWSDPLAGWCVYEVTGGTSMKRRSHPTPFAGMAEEKRLRWIQQWNLGMVPTFDVA